MKMIMVETFFFLAFVAITLMTYLFVDQFRKNEQLQKTLHEQRHNCEILSVEQIIEMADSYRHAAEASKIQN